MTIRLVVVDGHTLIQYALAHLAEQNPDIEMVGFAASARDGTDRVAQLQPDVVTIDSTLPDGDGLALARRLRDRYAALGIVLLTSQGEDDVLFRALETGASAFVPKTAPVAEILGAIRHAAVAARSFTAVGLADALSRRREVSERMSLSRRELEVLGLLQQGLSIPAIAQRLYVSPSTAKTYVGRVYEKLNVSNRAQALMAALELGLIRATSRPLGDTGGVLAG